MTEMITIRSGKYMDLENIPTRKVDLIRMASDIGGGNDEHEVCVVKAAYGSACSMSQSLRKQLQELSYRIVDTPHLSQKKNRADLTISIDAFEDTCVKRLDRVVFVSSDSDFSIVMDRLRSYGRQVWLVCRRADQNRTVFAHCCDRMFFLEDYWLNGQPPTPAVFVKERADYAEDLLMESLRAIGAEDLPVSLAELGQHMRRINPLFQLSGTGHKRLVDLARHCELKGILQIRSNAKGQYCVADLNASSMIASRRESSTVVSIPEAGVENANY
jgi:hypothetical protein